METIALNVGFAMYNGLLTRTVTKLYDTIASSNNHPEIRSVLEELDIQVILDVLEALCKEIPEGTSDSVSICLKNIEKCIDKIEQLLTEINNAKANHNSKWFSSWRTLDLDGFFTELKRQKDLLDKRVDLLIKVLTVHRSTSQQGQLPTPQQVDKALLNVSQLERKPKSGETVEFQIM